MKRPWFTWSATWAAVLVVAALIAALQEETAEQRLAFGATTLILTALLHSVLGERFILQPLFRREDLPMLFGGREFVPQTLRFVWHLFSIAFLGLAAVLVASITESSSPAVVRVVSVTAAASAAVAGIVSRGRHLSWVAFAAVAIATWLAV